MSIADFLDIVNYYVNFDYMLPNLTNYCNDTVDNNTNYNNKTTMCIGTVNEALHISNVNHPVHEKWLLEEIDKLEQYDKFRECGY
jgi:hypothetical protein